MKNPRIKPKFARNDKDQKIHFPALAFFVALLAFVDFNVIDYFIDVFI